MMPNRVSHHRRHAYTLVEMLIVVTIMIMLVAVTLPVAKKVMDGSQGREASRIFNAYLAMAKSRALQTGRPCGIYFPFPNPPTGILDPTGLTAAQYAQYWPVRQVTQLYLAEMPPPYSGSTTAAVGKIWNSGSTYVFTPWLNATNQQDTAEIQYLASLLLPGEQFLVRFGFKSDWYVCTNNNGTFVYNYPLQITAQPQVQPYGYANPSAPGIPFQILRSPRPVGNALELPQGACIDITYSGVGNSNRQFQIPSGVNSKLTGLTLMLSPNGAIDSMFLDTANASRIPMALPAGSLFFLIGKTEKAGNPTLQTNIALTDPSIFANPDDSNLADPNSLWVVISRGTGQVTTAENMPPPVDRSTLSSGNITIFPGDVNRQINFPAAGNIGAAIGKYVTYCRQAAIYGEQMTGR